MSLATSTLNKQRRIYFTYIWRGIALMALGMYAGITILRNGMGTSVQTGGGINVPLRKLMSWLTQQGLNAEQLLLIVMVGLFFLIAAIGLFNLVRGIWLMAPAHTMLGKSILTQQKGSESFGDMVDSINADMGQEPHSFGSVHIGRKWIMDIEAMRIDDIRGVFWFDQDMEDYVLCCVDGAQNIWAASLRFKDDRDDAAEYLQEILPNAVSGNKDAYMEFLRGEMAADADEADEPSDNANIPTELSSDATFSFVGISGIPTSNFTYDTAYEALSLLEATQTISLKVLTPKKSKVSEVFFTRTNSDWNVGMLYREDDEDCRIVKSVDEKQAQDIFKALMKEKHLPTFYATSK